MHCLLPPPDFQFLTTLFALSLSLCLLQLTPEENDRYQAPFKTPGNDRLPTLQWPREIPIESEGPENVVAITKECVLRASCWHVLVPN